MGCKEARLLSEQRPDSRRELESPWLLNAQTSCRASAGRWKRVFENSAVGIALINLDGRFEATNSAYQQLLGYTGVELGELTFMAITAEEFQEHNSMLIGDLLEGRRQQFNIEQQYWCKDGSLVWVRNNVSVVPEAHGTPHYILAIVENISDRKRAEESLRLSQARLSRAILQVATAAELAAAIAHEINQPLAGVVANAQCRYPLVVLQKRAKSRVSAPWSHATGLWRMAATQLKW